MSHGAYDRFGCVHVPCQILVNLVCDFKEVRFHTVAELYYVSIGSNEPRVNTIPHAQSLESMLCRLLTYGVGYGLG
jgi:hypothetical protein